MSNALRPLAELQAFARFTQHLQAIDNHVDQSQWTFSIKNLPKRLKFEQFNDDCRTDAWFLADEPSGNVVTGWILGHTSSIALGEEQGSPPPVATIGIAPLDSGDAMICAALLSSHSWTPEDEAEAPGGREAKKPKKTDMLAVLQGGVRMSRSMTCIDDGEGASPRAFTGIYDASTDFETPHSQMKTLRRSEIQLGDTVLVEFRITRQFENAGSTGSSGEYWKAGLDLRAIYLLEKRPEER